MIKIQLSELPAVRTDGGMEMSTETFMRLNTTWQHANVALAIQIWTFTTSEVEQCMAHLVEFGLMKFSSSEPDSTP